MKTPLLLCALTAFTATGAAWWWLRPPPAMAAAIPAPPPPPGHLTTVEDKAAVFQRAFWRQAAAEDSVLHAERREWSDPTGHITHWQWFLAVEPATTPAPWAQAATSAADSE